MQHDEFFVPDKDPGYVYKWCNSRERVMMQRSRQGYEVVTEPEKLPEAIRLVNPLPEGTPTSLVRRRGDLVLMKIRRDLWERNVQGPIEDMKSRHRITAEEMVAQVNDQTRRLMKKAGIPESAIPRTMVFVDSSREDASSLSKKER